MKKQVGGIYLENRLLNSEAYLKLSPLAIAIYQRFRQKEIRKQMPLGKRKIWTTINNGKIVFTYKEAFGNFSISRPTFSKALKELERYGFIDKIFQGGLCNTPSKYGISTRWEKYGTAEFKDV